MFSFNKLRSMVSGKKIRTKEDNFDLDLTKITPRIIAMSFPAATGTLQGLYRNRAVDVAEFLKSKYNDKWYVINLSEQDYDQEQRAAFKYRYHHVKYWRDHHAPTLAALVDACQLMYEFLNKDPQTVVAIHCNGGKGRTGTLICAYLMYVGFADSARNAITYYGKKRFETGLGVTQACQLRYIFYFEKLL